MKKIWGITLIICIFCGLGIMGCWKGLKWLDGFTRARKAKEALTCSLIARIHKGRAMLSDSIYICDSRLIYYIAVYDTVKKDGIKVFKMKRDGKILKPVDKNKGIPVITIVGPNALFATSNYQLLAVKNRTLVGKKIQNFIWTPFSMSIDSPDLEEVGKKYLGDLVDRVYEQLEEQGVKSRADTNKLVVQMVPTNLPLNLIFTEQAWFGDTKKTSVFLGANEENAFANTKSKQNAFALVQMLPSTYHMLRRKYPDAELPSNFFAGILNHTTAVKAMILLCDANLEYLNGNYQEKKLVEMYHSGVVEVIGPACQNYLDKYDTIQLELANNF
ncbi:MAG: hypothetical protein PHE59_00145 [Patescibacteria group bacterium]|nr:hypothetical protein [Patescibacteria group bacterium]MDD5164581.1 hypothetical protein [Patescibacteria group bacterium]MDD5534336.1 hypothetical protein [Patescibacteria group bacterium]